MKPLDDILRLQLAAFLVGMTVAEIQLRLLEGFIGPPCRPQRLLLVSDLHGIAVDPEFIKDVRS